ncbi:unnamed protein product [marine sediment metagenome]|uniref:Uncharacterized protein n=1 Tax=marine sediment metagenome TaxID=412755 RepID=X1NKB2_9ZZZZ
MKKTVSFDIEVPTDDVNEADMLINNALTRLERETGYTIDQIIHYPTPE